MKMFNWIQKLFPLSPKKLKVLSPKQSAALVKQKYAASKLQSLIYRDSPLLKKPKKPKRKDKR